MIIFSLVKNEKWLLHDVLKIAKLIKSAFSPEPHGIFGSNFLWSISDFKNYQNENNL